MQAGTSTYNIYINNTAGKQLQKCPAYLERDITYTIQKREAQGNAFRKSYIKKNTE